MSEVAEHILQNLDIVDVIGKYIQLKRSGSNFSALSPFQKEKTPSFMVSPQKQIFKDFSSGIGGNAITFVMEYEKVDFWDAIKILSHDFNIDISDYKFNSEKQQKVADQKEKYRLLNKYAQSFFKDNLVKSDVAKQYLREERKLSDEIIEKFNIGFAPDSHYSLIETLKFKGFSDDDLLKIGLVKRGSSGEIFSFFRNRIIFPISDNFGNIVAFTGRIINPEDKPKYLNTPETSLYDKSKILYGLDIVKKTVKDYDKIFVMEGQMDVIGLAKLGLPIGVASSGTSFTSNQIKLLKRYTPNIVFAFDNDKAGFEASCRAISISYNHDVFPKILMLPNEIKDIDDFANIILQSEFSVEDVLKKFENITLDGFDYVSKKLFDTHDKSSPVDRKRIMNKLFELLSNLQDISIINFYLEKLSKDLNINFDIMFAEFKQYLQTNKRYEKKVEKNNSIIDSTDQKYILGALFWDNYLDSDNKILSKFVNLISDVTGYLQNNFLRKVFENDLTNQDVQKLKESQMWWDKQFDSMRQVDKENIIINFLKKELNKNIKIIIKSKDITDKEKNKLIQSINSLIK